MNLLVLKVLLCPQLGVDLIPNCSVLRCAWYKPSSFFLEFFHRFNVCVFIVVVLVVGLLLDGLVLKPAHENYAAALHRYQGLHLHY